MIYTDTYQSEKQDDYKRMAGKFLDKYPTKNGNFPGMSAKNKIAFFELH